MHHNLPDAPGQRIHIGYKNIPPIISRCIDSNVLPCKAQAIHMDHSKRDCRRKKAYAKQQGQKNGIESLGLFASHGKIAVIEKERQDKSKTEMQIPANKVRHHDPHEKCDEPAQRRASEPF